ncbi:hypothetical protein ANN_01025 [Periplaneta americana]|uniref:Uncharacterized protein n=1 Tax=Periplaneta americana TaxID=6978 RepID=A0ABQ8TSH3_PERAM|nr:hypothetical protein ANN_01025 [Periplaneta americana]
MSSEHATIRFQGIPNQAPDTNKPMILNGPTSRNREGSDQSLMLAGNEFQSLGRAIVKEDEYEEVRWDGIVSIVSWRERVFRLWWEERSPARQSQPEALPQLKPNTSSVCTPLHLTTRPNLQKARVETKEQSMGCAWYEEAWKGLEDLVRRDKQKHVEEGFERRAMGR